MILIADSGSTKTDWAYISADGKSSEVVETRGINPFHQSDDDIADTLTGELLPALPEEKVEAVYFYGTGCTESQRPRMVSLLSNAVAGGKVFVWSDLFGAARALCGKSEGIACILGTGSNSCLFDGEEIVSNIPPLGYILGDEGSGAVLGKLFMNGIFKGSIGGEIRELYLVETHQTYDDIIGKVYRRPLANRFLASAALFIGRHKDEHPELRALVKRNFHDFIRNNIEFYGRRDLPLNFVGSMAWHFLNELTDVVESSGYRMGKVMARPIDGLVAYHKDERSCLGNNA